MGEGFKAGQAGPEALNFGAEGVEGAFVFKDLERCKSSGAAEGVAGVGVAVEECLERGVIAQEGTVDFIGGQGSGHGKVAAGEAFAQAEEVGGDAFLLAGEHRPGAAEAGGDFVGDEEYLVFPAEFRGPFQVAFGVDEHAPGALDEGFDKQGGDAAGVPFEDFLQSLMTAPVAGPLVGAEGAAVGVGRGGGEGGEEEGAVDPVEEVDAADADGAEGVAVVAFREVDERGFFRTRVGPLLPVLKSHFDGDFNRGRAVVRVEDAGQFRRGDFNEFFGQPDSRKVGEAQEGAVGDPVELVPNGVVDFRDAVAVDVAPHGGGAVYVAHPVDVFQVDPVGAGDDDGVFLRVVPHLGEGMPDELAVEVF